MTDMFRSEIAGVLAEHRLIDPSGWMDDTGRVEYQCRCGQTLHETPSESVYQGGAAMLASHQAAVLDHLGYRRASDTLDEFALNQLFSLVIERSNALAHKRDTSAWSMTTPDRNRLRGAHDELLVLRAALESFTQVRAAQDSDFVEDHAGGFVAA